MEDKRVPQVGSWSTGGLAADPAAPGFWLTTHVDTSVICQALPRYCALRSLEGWRKHEANRDSYRSPWAELDLPVFVRLVLVLWETVWDSGADSLPRYLWMDPDELDAARALVLLSPETRPSIVTGDIVKWLLEEGEVRAVEGLALVLAKGREVVPKETLIQEFMEETAVPEGSLKTDLKTELESVLNFGREYLNRVTLGNIEESLEGTYDRNRIRRMRARLDAERREIQEFRR